MSLSVPQSQYTGLSSDEKPILVDAVVGTQYYETDTTITYYWTGTKWKTWEQLYKEGRYIAITATGGTIGILQGILAGVGTFLRIFDVDYGLHQRINTSATINTRSGLRTIVGYGERALNPYLRVVFRLDQINDCSFYCGLSGYNATVGPAAADGTLSDPYPTNSAFGLKLNTNETDFKLYHNNASAPSTIEVTPVAPADTQLHTFEIRAINSVPKYQYKFDHATAWTDVTDDIPLETTEMSLQIWLENTAAVDKLWRLVDIYTRIDNRG